jgi:hypothetical protein
VSIVFYDLAMSHPVGILSNFLIHVMYVRVVFCVLQVVELFSAMRDQSKDGHNAVPNNGRSLSSAAALTSLCADISPSSSHFFEVCTINSVQ